MNQCNRIYNHEILGFDLKLTRKGTQMINSDLIQTLAIDRPILRMRDREKIIVGDLLWRPTEATKTPVFEIYSPKSGIWIKVTYAN